MALDLVIYAVVAAGLIVWLRSILGTRHGEERQRPTIISAETVAPVMQDAMGIQDSSAAQDAEKKSIEALAENPTNALSIADEAAQKGLVEISAADKTFQIKQFLGAAQDAFVMGVESFADGDLELLEDLLDTPVFKAFKTAIEDRNDKNHTQKTQIHAITKTSVIEAELNKTAARITIRFQADQTSVLTDEKDKVLHGHPDQTHKMIDIWTFGRDIKSRDPRWFVMETRGDFEGDNDIIPDA